VPATLVAIEQKLATVPHCVPVGLTIARPLAKMQAHCARQAARENRQQCSVHLDSLCFVNPLPAMVFNEDEHRLPAPHTAQTSERGPREQRQASEKKTTSMPSVQQELTRIASGFRRQLKGGLGLQLDPALVQPRSHACSTVETIVTLYLQQTQQAGEISRFTLGRLAGMSSPGYLIRRLWPEYRPTQGTSPAACSRQIFGFFRRCQVFFNSALKKPPLVHPLLQVDGLASLLQPPTTRCRQIDCRRAKLNVFAARWIWLSTSPRWGTALQAPVTSLDCFRPGSRRIERTGVQSHENGNAVRFRLGHRWRIVVCCQDNANGPRNMATSELLSTNKERQVPALVRSCTDGPFSDFNVAVRAFCTAFAIELHRVVVCEFVSFACERG
jgi:hypothetical protein